MLHFNAELLALQYSYQHHLFLCIKYLFQCNILTHSIGTASVVLSSGILPYCNLLIISILQRLFPTPFLLPSCHTQNNSSICSDCSFRHFLPVLILFSAISTSHCVHTSFLTISVFFLSKQSQFLYHFLLV